MSIKAKKRLIIILSVIILLIGGTLIGANLYIDSILNRMDQKDEFEGSDVGANKLDENVVNIALLGVDNDEGSSVHRSDVMKIISLDFNNKKIKITSLQRDNAVFLPMYGGYEKLNLGYQFNETQGALSALNYNFDMNITKYVKFSFDSVEHVVDILGGVDITVTNAEAGQIGLAGAGTYRLNGAEALSYSRIRAIDSDYERMQRQNNVINSLLTGVSGQSPFEILDTVNQVMPYIETNVSNGSIKNYLTSLVSFDLGNVEQYQFPKDGYDSILSTVSINGHGPHYVLKDFSAEVELLHKNIYGKKSKASDNVKKVEKDTKALAGY